MTRAIACATADLAEWCAARAHRIDHALLTLCYALVLLLLIIQLVRQSGQVGL